MLHLTLSASVFCSVVGRSCKGIPRKTQARSGEAEGNGPYTVRIYLYESQLQFFPAGYLNAWLRALAHLAETCAQGCVCNMVANK